MRTTTRPGWKFEFSISDLGRLLGKSPVTIRGWDHKHLVDIPRGRGGDRQVHCDGVRTIGEWALRSRRISQTRFDLVSATITLLEQIERSNDRKVKR